MHISTCADWISCNCLRGLGDRIVGPMEFDLDRARERALAWRKSYESGHGLRLHGRAGLPGLCGRPVNEEGRILPTMPDKRFKGAVVPFGMKPLAKLAEIRPK